MKRYTIFLKQHWFDITLISFEIALVAFGIVLLILAVMQYIDALEQLKAIKGSM